MGGGGGILVAHEMQLCDVNYLAKSVPPVGDDDIRIITTSCEQQAVQNSLVVCKLAQRLKSRQSTKRNFSRS